MKQFDIQHFPMRTRAAPLAVLAVLWSRCASDVGPSESSELVQASLGEWACAHLRLLSPRPTQAFDTGTTIPVQFQLDHGDDSRVDVRLDSEHVAELEPAQNAFTFRAPAAGVHRLSLAAKVDGRTLSAVSILFAVTASGTSAPAALPALTVIEPLPSELVTDVQGAHLTFVAYNVEEGAAVVSLNDESVASLPSNGQQQAVHRLRLPLREGLNYIRIVLVDSDGASVGTCESFTLQTRLGAQLLQCATAYLGLPPLLG